MKKIDFIYFDAGGGHRAAANALQAVVDSQHRATGGEQWDIRLVNLQEVLDSLDVFRKVTVAAEIVLDRSLPRLLDGTAELTVQDLSRGGYFRGRKTDDGRIDWSKGAREIHDLVRAVAPPYPGAFTLVDGAHQARFAEFLR